MEKIYLFLADGFEDIEALTPVDFLRRADLDISTVSINPTLEVRSSHGVTVKADCLLADVDTSNATMLIAPGGMPGAQNLYESPGVCKAFKEQAERGGYIAAICAAPAVLLSQLGILEDKRATCYPGFEQKLIEGGAAHVAERVVTDGKIITANGPSSAIPFALQLISVIAGEASAQTVAEGILL
ncbi:MAG: DJ-1/PfpI family protein [Duncaniella sp.]|nr:DJ-1/PfpI family protein [Duncaniella sp.]MDE6765911.1 DJ-1/PfpI family protein [Duncaniella sp.]